MMADDPGFVNLMNPKLQKMLKGASAHMNEEVIPERVNPYESERRGTDIVSQGEGLGPKTAEERTQHRPQPQKPRVDPYSQVQYNQHADDELIYDTDGDGALEYSPEEEQTLNEMAARKYPKGSVLAQVADNPIEVPEDNRLTGGVPEELLAEINPGRRQRTQRRQQPASQGAGANIDYDNLNNIITAAVGNEIARQLPGITKIIKPIIEGVVKEYAIALKKAIVNENTKLLNEYGLGNLNEVDGFIIGDSFKVADKAGRVYKAKFTPVNNEKGK